MDYLFEKNYDNEQNCWFIEVSGEIDIFNSDKFKSDLLLLADEKQCNIKIDCTNLKYIDSTALGVLVAILKRVKSYNGEIYLLKLKPSIEKLFKITNLDKVFTIEGDAND